MFEKDRVERDPNDDFARWLAGELARQLRPVAAPEGLWARVKEAPRRPERQSGRGSSRYLLLAAATGVLVAAGSAAILRANIGHRHPTSLEAVAAAPMDFRCEDPREMRRWIKAKTNLEVEISSSVRLLGVRLLQLHGLPAAAIEYEAGGQAAMLLVSKSQGDKPAPHVHPLPSWSAAGQTFTIAYANQSEPNGACVICHTNF